MINRFYLKNYLSFKKIELGFDKGLVVFTGASGAGKSVLMSSILALFGTTDAKADLSEVSIENQNIVNENYDIDKDDDIIIKQTTQAKTRYLLNDQTISKKNLKQFTNNFSKHLHLKDTSDFKSQNIIKFLDFLGSNEDENYKTTLANFQNEYKNYTTINQKLNKILNDEKDLDELIAFTKFEITKIESIDPKAGEYDELKHIKSNLSKKEKITKIIDDIQPFLANTHKITNALNILEVNSAFFEDTISDVESHIEKFYNSVSNLTDGNIEDILTRIEDLALLNKKYGGIEEALEYKEKKKKELDGYENISFEKAILTKNLKKSFASTQTYADKLSSFRSTYIVKLKNKIDQYLDLLYLENLQINITNQKLNETGIDNIEFLLNNTTLNKISSGEFNRLRLALLTARSYYEIDTNGILFLDEIDANLSGKESQSIAKVLAQLAKHYQIFAISHQPQLSATAKQHFLVKKESDISTVMLLNNEQRVGEIARMISGENITKEALQFAQKLL